jgi:hypothetical protein
MVLPGGPSLEKKGLRFDGKVLRAEGQAEPPWPMLSCSLVSASTCICAQSNREVHHLFTAAFFLFAASPGVDLYLKAEMDVACYEGCPVNAD